MNKFMRRMMIAVIAVCLVVSFVFVAVGCNKDKTESSAKTYTYTTYSTALATNWNPHAWETNADQSVLLYLSTPFVDLSIKDSVNGEYQWVYEMATSVTDVTESNQSDLSKYNCSLPSGTSAESVTEGYVFEIKLNENAKWQNGEKITADDYIYSMQQLLNPKMRNYRANLYIAGESAIAGAANYYNSEAPIYDPVVPPYGEGDTPDYSFDITSQPVYINLTSQSMTISSYSFADIKDLGYIRDDEKTGATGATSYSELSKLANPYGFIEVNEETKPMMLEIMDQYLSAFGLSIYNSDKTVNEEFFKEFLFYNTGKFSDKIEYDTVGCYKVDDYTIRYVTATYLDLNNFLTSLTSTWLVYKPLYEANKDTSGALVTTRYGTSKETTMSYGVYKLDSFQEEKQMVFTQNENWYGFTKNDKGELVSYTNFEVDGKSIEQWKTDKIVINVMDDAAAKQAFLKGELSEWSPSAEELSNYNLSDQLYRVDETYTMSFFFNTNEGMLKTMDATKGNQNSVVLTNTNFRKAFSLAIDRSEYVTATPGYQPTYSLMNELYFYDVYNDPASIYRHTDEAMQAICNLYGVQYGEGTAYKDLETAYNSITGYNLTEAKALMKQACDELVAAGLYKKGEPIKIRVAWAAGALTSDDNKQIALMNKYINAAVDGSGFGTVTLEAVGNLNNRYAEVPNGNFAIGYGAWGGAAFYPFRNFQVYMDPTQYDINEAANYDPTTETLTLNIQGKDVTMTWQDWSNCMIGTGEYAMASNDVKLEITAKLEEAFLNTYYRIPICSTTVCSMLSYQCKYYTESYNIMYGFGGLRLMDYTMSDAEWAQFVKDEGGTLSYV